MKAELNADELQAALAFVTKGVRGKQARERAKALLTFGVDDICIDFNDFSANCPAKVTKTGRYVVNPFIFRPFVDTYGTSSINPHSLRHTLVQLGETMCKSLPKSSKPGVRISDMNKCSRPFAVTVR